MIYLIEGNEQFLINQKLKELIEASGVSNDAISIYDEMSDFKAFLEDLFTPSLFFDKKIILYRNAPFLNDKFNEDTSLLSQFFTNAHSGLDLIIYTENKSFNTKLNIYKELKKNANHFTFKQKTYRDFIDSAYELINAYHLDIDKDASKLLVEIAKNHLDDLDRNLKTLSLYNDHVDVKVVKALCDVSLVDDIFDFTNALFEKDLKKAITLLRELFVKNISAFYIIGSLASQLRFLNSLYVLYYEEHYDLDTIMKMMNVKSTYRINKNLSTIAKYKGVNFLSILAKLSSLEQSFKSDDSIDTQTRMELFVLEVIG